MATKKYLVFDSDIGTPMATLSGTYTLPISGHSYYVYSAEKPSVICVCKECTVLGGTSNDGNIMFNAYAGCLYSSGLGTFTTTPLNGPKGYGILISTTAANYKITYLIIGPHGAVRFGVYDCTNKAALV